MQSEGVRDRVPMPPRMQAPRESSDVPIGPEPTATPRGTAYDLPAHGLSDTTINLLRAKFGRFDVDGSGGIELRELANLVKAIGVRMSGRRLRELARAMDKDADDKVTFSELVGWYDRMSAEASAREARRAKGIRGRLARVRRALTPPDAVRVALAWAVMWIIFAFCGIIAVTFANTFGADQTRIMLLSWTLAEFQTLGVEEPIVIGIGVLMPWLMDRLMANDAVAEMVNDVLGSTVGAAIGAIKRLFA